MAEVTSSAGYDVFLCHNSKDKPLVRELAGLLRERNLRVYFDEAEILPGQPWQEALEAAIETSKAALILHGPSGLGPWAIREMRAFNSEFVRRGAIVIPTLLPGVADVPQLPVFLREFNWLDLRAGLASSIDRLLAVIRRAPPSAPSTPLFRLWNVPPLPDSYQPRSEVESLRRALLSPSGDPFAVTGQHTRFAVEGMGGVGKTVLATALARDAEVRRAFPGGVYWLTFGQAQTPETLLELQTRLASAVLGRRVVLEASTTEGQREEVRQLLRDTFSSRACLLILDDVWQGAHAKPFNVMGDLGRLLVTTRKREVALGLGAEPHRVDELASAEASALLARYADLLPESLPPEGPELARACGELPLALAAVGSSLRGRPANQWRMKLERLRQGVLRDAGQPPLPEYSHPSVVAALQASVDDLSADMRSRYVDLAVFPEDVAIPEAVLRRYWALEGADELAVAECVNVLVDRSLARRDDKGRVLLHDLQHDHIRAVAGDPTPLHRRLVDAYRRASADGGLHQVPPDGYFFERIAEHLRAAEGAGSLRRLLLDPRWLAAKLNATSINALLLDFEFLDLASDEPLRLLRDAIRLSAHVLARHPEELSSQLLARLRRAPEDELVGFCSQVEAEAHPPCLVPLWPSLTPPGGALLRTLDGHSDFVSAVALSGDGKTVVSGSDDDTLKVWDVGTGKELRTLEGPGRRVNAVALSWDGKTVVSASGTVTDKGTLKVWDVGSGKKLRTLEAPGGRVKAVALSWDGKTVVSASWDNTLKVWDVGSGKKLHTLEGHRREVNALALSWDGKTVVSGSDDNTLKVWDVGSGKELRTLEGHGREVNAVALSWDGKTVVSGSHDNTLKVWEVGTGKELRTLEGHGDNVTAVALSWDGKRAVSGSWDKTLKVWEVGTGKELRTLEGHGDCVIAVALSGDGKTVVSGSRDNSLKVWEVGTGKELRTLEGHGDNVNAVALSGDGKTVVCDDMFHKGTLKVWDVETGKELHTLGHGNWVNVVALSEDGKTMVSGSGDVLHGKWLLTARSTSGSRRYSLKVWDVGTGKKLRALEGHDDSVTAVALSGNVKTVVSGSSDKTLKVWDVGTGKELRTLEGHDDWVRAVALSGDGKTVVSGSSDFTLKVWDVATGACLLSFTGEAGFTSVAIRGNRVLAGDRAGRIHLFALVR